MALDIAKIRNVAFVGHGGVGKTSLVEGILFAAAAVNRLGKVDDGTTTTDFDPDEIKRKISLSTAVAFCDYKGHRLNLIDTPGYGDFAADARAGLRVAEGAVVVVDAVAGRAGPDREDLEDRQRLRPAAHRRHQPDGPRARRLRAHARLAAAPAQGAAHPAARADRRARPRFTGVVDVLTQKAHLREGRQDRRGPGAGRPRGRRRGGAREADRGGRRDGRRPAQQVPRGRRARRGGDAGRSSKAIAAGALVPVLAAAATRLIGVAAAHGPDRGRVALARRPAGRRGDRTCATRARSRARPTPRLPLAALVFKTISDPHVGKLSVFRVYSGTHQGRQPGLNATRGRRRSGSGTSAGCRARRRSR